MPRSATEEEMTDWLSTGFAPTQDSWDAMRSQVSDRLRALSTRIAEYEDDSELESDLEDDEDPDDYSLDSDLDEYGDSDLDEEDED